MCQNKMSSDEECEFRINKAYAEKYDTWRRKEELQKLKSKYGDMEFDENEFTSSSSEEEDEDAEALTDQVEKDWLETLAALRRKDPKIYEKGAKFYHSEESSSSTDSSTEGKDNAKSKSSKLMLLKDYERKILLEKGGQISEESSNEDEDVAAKMPGYFEEQDELKKSFKSAIAESESESEEEFLVKRKKSKKEKEEEEEEFKKWTMTDEAKHFVADIWKEDGGLDDGDKFLRDYIVNKRYLDTDRNRIPSYDEIVNDEDVSEEEEELDKEELFEKKYNFRFEEPDQDFIKSYPRTIGESVRMKDTRRADKRKEIKERKSKEKEKKKEEIKQLKNLKRKEIMKKLEAIKEITGNESLGISEQDLEGDFDPKQYDQLMQKVFNEDYYDDQAEEEKPVLQKEEEEKLGLDVDAWDQWHGDAEDGAWQGDEDAAQDAYADDPDFVMDADYDPEAPKPTKNNKKKGKKKTKFLQAVETKKPVFDPNEKTFEEYFDEYYKLDYEDIIGDLPCRFKYRQVVPNDFGLSVDEVLKAKDKELNTWASLKKTCQYRTEEEEKIDVKIYRRKATNSQKKLQILHSLNEEEEPKPSQTNKKKKKHRPQNTYEDKVEPGPSNKQDFFNKKRPAEHSDETPKKKVKHEKSLNSVSQSNSPSKTTSKKKRSSEESVSRGFVSKVKVLTEVLVPAKQNDTTNKRKKKKKKPTGKGSNSQMMSDERLKAYGFNPKKFKYTQMAKLKQQTAQLS